MGSEENIPSKEEILEAELEAKNQKVLVDLFNGLEVAPDSEITEITLRPDGYYSAVFLGHKIDIWTETDSYTLESDDLSAESEHTEEVYCFSVDDQKTESMQLTGQEGNTIFNRLNRLYKERNKTD